MSRFIQNIFIVATVTLAVGACTTFQSDQRSDFRLASTGATSGLWALTPYERGKTHLMDGQLGLSVNALQTALARGDNSLETLNALAAAYDLLGRFDVARRYYKRALSRDPNSLQTLNNLGYSHLLRGEYTQAASYLTKAKALGEANETVQANFTLVESLVAKRDTSGSGDGPPTTQALTSTDPEERTPGNTIRAMWVERTTQEMQTLVTSPGPNLKEAIWRTGVDPQLAAPAGRYPIQLASQTTDVSGKPVLSKGHGSIAKTAPRTAKEVTDHAKSPDTSVETTLEVAATDHRSSPLAPPRASENKNGGLRLADALIEVSNGAGRRHMAARMQTYLKSKGVPVALLTNDDNYRNKTTVIFYRSDYRNEADAIAGRMPIPVSVHLVNNNNQHSGVRLRVGGDLLDFDKELLSVSGNAS